MLIAASKLQNVPLIGMESHSRLGTIKQCIFHPDTGQLLAFAINLNSVIPRVNYISFNDIVSFEQHAVVGDRECLFDLDDYTKVKNILSQKRPILGQKVLTRDQKYLGDVTDVMIEKTTGQMVEFEVHHLFSKRIFRFNDIDQITTKGVVVKNDLEMVKSGVAVETNTA
ncbi:MAG: PRC-barrel domain-containing protein [Patescibacteria group bacterium]